jgi:hypothetical protein
MKLSEIINRIIALATAIRQYWDEEGPKRHPNYPVIRLDEDPDPPPPQREELRTLLMGLSPAATYLLLCIMYVGRGNFGTEDLLGCYEQRSDTFRKPEWAVNQMLGKSPLALYLASGLEELTEAGIDVDGLLEQ